MNCVACSAELPAGALICGENVEIVTTGRHDPCVGIRAVPIGEAMIACVIADHYLRHRGQIGQSPAWPFKQPSA